MVGSYEVRGISGPNIEFLRSETKISPPVVEEERAVGGVRGMESLMNTNFANLPTSTFNDLKIRDPSTIRAQLPHIFSPLPSSPSEFSSGFKNPCWVGEGVEDLECLPYVYLLGQPKSGTSDLWKRIVNHPMVDKPSRKEVRWFTRGEFLKREFEGGEEIGPSTRLSEFTHFFEDAADAILRNPSHITIDGGPHTLWFF